MRNIVITEAFLRTLQTQYARQVDDIEGVKGKIHKYGDLPESSVDITQRFTLHLGGTNFSEAQAADGRLDKVRAGLVSRLTGAKDELRILEYGVKFLLEDTKAVENLNTLSAEDWEYFMPKSGNGS